MHYRMWLCETWVLKYLCVAQNSSHIKTMVAICCSPGYLKLPFWRKPTASIRLGSRKQPPQRNYSMFHIPEIANSWDQHGAHLGPVGPRWAPCWPHKPCYQGYSSDYKISHKIYIQLCFVLSLVCCHFLLDSYGKITHSHQDCFTYIWKIAWLP